MSNYIVNENGIDRSATTDEIADIEARNAQALLDNEALENAKAARQSALAKLAALGLTDEEINAIIGGV